MTDTARPLSGSTEQRVLWLSPESGGSLVDHEVLKGATLPCHECQDMAELCRELQAGAGALLLAEEMLGHADAASLVEALGHQPTWSDLPIVLLTADGADSPLALSALEVLGNVMVIERPVRSTTLVSTLRSALKARRRQYQVRDGLEALRESEGRFRELADQAPVLIWVNGLEGCEFVNREYLQFFGMNIDQVQGLGWARVLHPDDAGRYMQAYDAAFERQALFQATARFLRADGQYRWLKSVGHARFTRDGAFLGYAGCSLDVTDLKLYEEALEDTDRRKDEFLATLAHELRNPLAPIRNGVHLLRLKADDATVRARVLETFDRQVGHLVRLVDDLLEVSRVSRGQLELRKEPVDVQELIENAIEASEPLIASAKHRLDLVVPREPLRIEADPVRMTQVVVNLLNNAVRYTDPGGTIRVCARREGRHVIVSVEDTGIGIPAEMLPRVFDTFTQVGRGGNRSQSGLGIGLTLVRSLVQLHGGRVEAHSEGPGRGSTFTVTLPALPGAVPAAVDAEDAPLSMPAGPSGRRVMVVDDHRDSAESLAVLLSTMGHEVSVAHDGLGALRLARELRPEVMLLDIGMPGMDGYELATRLRHEPGNEHLVLVALTGYGQQEDRRRARAAGFDEHLVKPANLQALEKLLASGPARRAGTS